jgi:hypothetical protein
VDGQRIAKIILPLVIMIVVGNWIASQSWAPPWAERVVTIAFVGGIIAVLVLGFRGSAWGTLAERYPARQAYSGTWVGCPTLHVSNVRADQPGYQRDKVRFVGMVRLGVGGSDLYLSSRIPFFNVLMPPVQIPRSAITNVKTYECSGLVGTPKDSASLIQLTYDPNFKGRIAEVAIGEPPVYLQMQAGLIEPLIAQPKP